MRGSVLGLAKSFMHTCCSCCLSPIYPSSYTVCFCTYGISTLQKVVTFAEFSCPVRKKIMAIRIMTCFYGVFLLRISSSPTITEVYSTLVLWSQKVLQLL